MERASIPNVEGITLTMPKKEEILSYLKQQMLQSKLKIPYDQELIAELNIEKYELTTDHSYINRDSSGDNNEDCN